MWDGYRAALRDDPAGVVSVLAEGERAGWPREEVAWVIERESAWDPRARNPTSDASGLIQFMPATAHSLGTTAEAIRTMSRGAQAPLVGRYLARIPGRWTVPGDTYLAVFSPAHVGAPADTLIYPPDTAGWRQNPGLRESPDGAITAGSVRQVGRPPAGGLPGPGGTLPARRGTPWLPWLLVVAVVLSMKPRHG